MRDYVGPVVLSVARCIGSSRGLCTSRPAAQEYFEASEAQSVPASIRDTRSHMLYPYWLLGHYPLCCGGLKFVAMPRVPGLQSKPWTSNPT